MITYIIRKTSSIEKSACAISLGILGTLIWNMIFDILQPQQSVLDDFSPEQLLILGNPRQFEVLIFTIGILGFFYVFNVVEKYIHHVLKKFYKEYLFDRNEQIPPSINKEETKPISYTWDINFFYDEISIFKRDFQSLVSLIYLIITLCGGILCVFLLILLQSSNFLLRYFIGELVLLTLIILLLISILRSTYPQCLHNLKRIGLLSLHAYYGKTETLEYAKSGSWLFLQQEIDSHLKNLDREFYSDLHRKLKEIEISSQHNETEDIWNMTFRLCSLWNTFNKDQKLTTLENFYSKRINYSRVTVPLHNFYRAVYSEINRDESYFEEFRNRIYFILNNYVKKYPKSIFFDLFNPNTLLTINEISHTEFWKLNENDCAQFVNTHFSKIIKSEAASVNINNENEQLGLEDFLKLTLTIVIRQFQAFKKLRSIVNESRRLIEEEKKAILPYQNQR